MSLAQALRDLITRYEYDGIPNDSLPTVEAARAALSAPPLTYERVKQLWREASMAYNEDRDPSPVHLFARAIEREHGIGNAGVPEVDPVRKSALFELRERIAAERNAGVPASHTDQVENHG